MSVLETRGDKALLSGWGRTAPTVAEVVEAGSDADVAAVVARRPARGVVARGLGRSYGDAAQNAGGAVVSLPSMDRILAVDVAAATTTVEAGVSLDTLMRTLLPLGLFVPVTPGTRVVTVGGAIAADVHGKDHHITGSFCNHVAWIDLLLADGSVRRVSAEEDAELFWATAGGMGLTGIVLRASIRMRRVETAYVVVDTERARDLDDLMDRLSSTDHLYEYSVSWVDCLSRGARLGRAVLTRGRPATRQELPRRAAREPLAFRPRTRLTAPDIFPAGLVNRASVAAFDELWYRKAPAERRDEVQAMAPFFHPLDGISRWHRVYGPRGFIQYQFVVPFGAEATVRRVLEIFAAGGPPGSLAVLKRFGPANPGPLSFPTPGWTLAVDVPVQRRTAEVLDRLDRLVLDAGGRLYLAKDSRLPAAALPAMYPRLDEWLRVRRQVDPDSVFTSDLSRRLGL